MAKTKLTDEQLEGFNTVTRGPWHSLNMSQISLYLRLGHCHGLEQVYSTSLRERATEREHVKSLS
jgi:hypothetical protein